MTWSVYSVDTITGGDRERIAAVSDFPWERFLSAGGTGSATLQLGDLGYSTDDLNMLTAEWARSFVLDWDGGVEFAGIVTGSDYAMESGTLKLDLTDLWGILTRRGGYDQNAAHVEDWTVTYTSMTLGTLAKRAMQLGTTGPTSPSLLLPVTLPADVAGSLSRSFDGSKLDLVGDILDDLLAEGLDIDFRPRWVSGELDWQMLNDPNTGSHEWAPQTPDSGVSGFHALTDGSRMTNHSIVVGAGSGPSMLVRSDRNRTSTLPLLDRMDYRKNISDVDQANAIVFQTLDQYAAATSSWEFEVLADGNPGVGALKLGDSARFVIDNDPRLGSGTFDRRIVKISGTLGEKITVACHPTGGA